VDLASRLLLLWIVVHHFVCWGVGEMLSRSLSEKWVYSRLPMSCDITDARELSFWVQRVVGKAILQQLVTPDSATMVRETLLRVMPNLQCSNHANLDPVCPVQLYLCAALSATPNLHQRIHPPALPRGHGPQQGWVSVAAYYNIHLLILPLGRLPVFSGNARE
jgi:hypothetical protein